MRANFVRGGNLYKNLDIGKYRSDAFKDKEEIAWAEEPLITGKGRSENKSISLYKDKDLFTVETGTDGGHEWANMVKFTYIENAYKYFKELVDRYPEIKIYQDLNLKNF